MRKNNLGQTGIGASQIGFGCVQLTTHRERSEAIQILEHAFLQGITYFDVSRIYGFGRAEGILGEFLRGKRQQVTVATKFGIQPPSGLAGNRRVINLVKRLLRPFPSLLQRAQRRGSEMVQSGVFTPENAVLSLETSLRELGTDSVDVFLLHEASLSDAQSEPLIEALRGQVDRGTIRCFGVASSFHNLRDDASLLPSAYQVVQFEDNAVARNLARLKHREGRALVTHSIFQPLDAIRRAVSDQPAIAVEYSSKMNLDLADTGVLASLLLQSALRANSSGVVLFSSVNPERISSNVREAESLGYEDSQISIFSEFAAAILNAVPLRAAP